MNELLHSIIDLAHEIAALVMADIVATAYKCRGGRCAV